MACQDDVFDALTVNGGVVSLENGRLSQSLAGFLQGKRVTAGSFQPVHPFAQTLNVLAHDVLNIAKLDTKRPLTIFKTFLIKLSAG